MSIKMGGIGSSFEKDIEISKPENVIHPLTVSLHLLIKNGESCVKRLFENVHPFIDEIVAIVNDTTDNTIPILTDLCKEIQLPLKVIEVNFSTNPEFYIIDTAVSYKYGNPIDNEEFGGPFTEKPLLADWAGIRNLGFKQCTKDYILFLIDAVVDDPASIPSLCEQMYQGEVEMLCSRYIFSSLDRMSFSESYRERLIKNVDHIYWNGVTHEVLMGAKKKAYLEGSLIVRDLKDSLGKDIRIPGRCLKVLYNHCRKYNWNVSPRDLIYLGMECKRPLPRLAKAVLNKYLEKSLWPEERAWACSMVGEIYEKELKYSDASKWYERSLREHPGSKSAFRLCRSKFNEGKWSDSIAAYELGKANSCVVQLLDNGPAYDDLSKILIAVAYEKLGKFPESLAICDEALKIFPTNQRLLVLRNHLARL
jgi:tetratricopeptide (TPR) repeat protein